MAKIDSVFDFSDKALVELKSWLEPWFLRDTGCECVPASPSGDTIDAIIQGLGPDAWWKLDESSGTVAHDSSGNGHDLTVPGGGGYTAPTWGQAAGPPGTTTAQWVDNTTRVHGSLSAFTDNFTAGVWVNQHASGGTEELLGQGAGGYHVTGPGGWALLIATNKFALGSNGNLLYADNTFSLDTWYFVAAVRDAGTWKLYQDGLLQSTTIATSPGAGVTDTWLGNDDWPSHGSYLADTDLSYGFIFNSVLTGAELLSIYTSAALPAGANAGKALVASGLGGTYWDYAGPGSGATASRPTLASNGSALLVGAPFFDTTLGQPIWWDGAAWVDATGAAV